MGICGGWGILLGIAPGGIQSPCCQKINVPRFCGVVNLFFAKNLPILYPSGWTLTPSRMPSRGLARALSLSWTKHRDHRHCALLPCTLLTITTRNHVVLTSVSYTNTSRARHTERARP